MNTKCYLCLGLVACALWWIGCGSEYPNCDDDEECSQKQEYCVDGLCRPCRNDGHCQGANKCMKCNPTQYVCERDASCCMSDMDCPDGRCWDQSGQNTGICGPQCRGDHPDDCADKTLCQNGKCTEVDCTRDEHCNRLSRCQNNNCEAVEGCELKPIYFSLNSSALNPTAKKELKVIAECLKKTGALVQIQAFTDDTNAKPAKKMSQTEKMAKATMRFLTGQKVAEDQLEILPYSGDKPACSETTKQCRMQNRRVEFAPVN